MTFWNRGLQKEAVDHGLGWWTIVVWSWIRGSGSSTMSAGWMNHRSVGFKHLLEAKIWGASGDFVKELQCIGNRRIKGFLLKLRTMVWFLHIFCLCWLLLKQGRCFVTCVETSGVLVMPIGFLGSYYFECSVHTRSRLPINDNCKTLTENWRQIFPAVRC